MDTHASGSRRKSLKTAAAIADPVLVVLNPPEGRVVLLAQDMTHEKAQAFHLSSVRWVRARAGIWPILLRRSTRSGRRLNLTLRRRNGQLMTALRHEGWIETQDRPSSFAVQPISLEQYRSLRAAAPRKLLAAGSALLPRQSRLAGALRTLHKARIALRRTLVPKLAV